MKKGLALFLAFLMSTQAMAEPASLTKLNFSTTVPTDKTFEPPHVRLKDLAHFSSVRDNPLVGYGLVVGLNNSGDTMSRSAFTRESLTGMLERLGVNIRDGAVPSGKNVAAVMVTASLPPFGRPGAKLDVTVSALGDAKDLRGGVLLVTPLLGADGNVYAVAQGSVLVSGTQAQGKAAKEVKGVPTSARISNGAVIERDMGFQLTALQSLNLTLHNPDFTTAQRIANAINEEWKKDIAKALDASSVHISIPSDQQNNLVGFMTEIEQITVQPDLMARVVIDDSNGVVTITSMAKIFPVALTHGSITVKIVEKPNVHMPDNQNNPLRNLPLVNQVNQNSSQNDDVAKNMNELLVKMTEEQTKERQVLLEKQKAEFEAAELAGKAKGAIPFGPAQQRQLSSKHEEQMNALQSAQASTIAKLIADIQQQKPQGAGPGDSSMIQTLDGITTTKSGAVITDSSSVQIKEEKGRFAVLNSGADLKEFVDAMNALGATPREMMTILQNIKAAGALQAEIILT